eukprot:c23969_g8_i1 orf=150-2060(+)
MGRGFIGCSSFKDYVLEHLPHACIRRDLNHVDGEIEDEDGDRATAFIIADPLPQHHVSEDSQFSQQVPLSSPFGLSGRKRLFLNEMDGFFICNVCSESLSLHLLEPNLECGCLCCTPCLRQQIEFMLSQRYDLDGPGVPQAIEMLQPMQCPSCSSEAAISSSSIQLIAPEVCKVLEEKASQVFFEAAEYIHCPGCSMLIEKVAGDIPAGVAPSGVPEFDRTAPFTELDDHGKPLSRAALFDKYNNYYRCPLCKEGFCGLCMRVPYHLGYTCQEYVEFEKAKRCIYCETPIRRSDACENQASSITIRQLQRCVDKEGVDASWCVEKRDLLSVWDLVSSVCDAKECKKQLQQACTRKLECGHRCGGIKSERACLPCLEDGCREKALLPKGHSMPSADDWCTICMVEPLRSAPSIQLKCGHIYHFDCAKKKLKEGFPGPEITFGFLRCPQCSDIMDHASLESILHKPLELLSLVKEKALKRLKMEKPKKSMKPEELEAYALNKYQYYLCCKCQNPYYGGNRDCRADAGPEGDGARNPHNPLELVCGGCSAAVDADMTCQKGHGNKYIEHKCKYCCSMATFFCFGQTHFCTNCHLTRPDGNPDFIPQACKGPQSCPLKVAHAPNGEECCLGCSMCRILSQ